MRLFNLIAIFICLFFSSFEIRAVEVDREIELIKEEISLLKSQLESLNKEHLGQKNLRLKDLDNTVSKLTKLRLENEELSRKLSEIDLSLPEEAKTDSVLKELQFQAADLELESANKNWDQLFVDLIKGISAGSNIVLKKEQLVYDEMGTPQKSTLLNISNLVSFSLSDEKSFSILSSKGREILQQGDFNSKLSLGNLRTLSDKKEGSLLIIDSFIFGDDTPKSSSIKANDNLLAYLEEGGLLMWPIFILGIVAILIMAERFFMLFLFVPSSFRRSLKDFYRDRSLSENKNLMAQFLLLLKKNKDLDRTQIEEILVEKILSIRLYLERNLNFLNIIAVVSPLLGLLGTVTGMVATFGVIKDFGTGNPQLMSEGISSALLTTQFGLVIAIPALMAHGLLSRKLEKIIMLLELSASSILNHYLAQKTEKNEALEGQTEAVAEEKFSGISPLKA